MIHPVHHRTARSLTGWRIRNATIEYATIACAVTAGFVAGLIVAVTIYAAPELARSVAHGISDAAGGAAAQSSFLTFGLSAIAPIVGTVSGIWIMWKTSAALAPVIERGLFERFGLDRPDQPSTT